MNVFAGRRGHAIAVAILLIVPLIFFWDMIAHGQEPLAPDIQAWRPLGEWRKQAEATLGELPLWCPAIFSGMPAQGSFIATPSAPLDLMRHLREAVGNRVGITFYLHLVVGSLALYLWLTRTGRSPLAAMGGTLIFTMTPYMLGLISAGHNTKIRALYMAPLVFLALETLLRRRTLAAALFLGIALAYQLWCNHPQITYYTVLLGALYALGVLLLERPEGWRGRGLVWGLAAGLLALVLAGALIMEPYASVLEYSPYSIRGGTSALQGEADAAGGAGWDYATAWSYPPAELICFLFPAWFGLEGQTYWGTLTMTQSTHYLGVMVLLLALVGAVLTHGRRRWVLVGMGLFILLVGFGRNLPVLYRPMYLLLPMFKSFRVPSMIYALLPLPAALLAARGLDAVLGEEAWGRTPAPARKGEGRRSPEGPPRSLIAHWGIVTIVLAFLLVVWLVAGGAIADGLRRAGSFVKAEEIAGMNAQQIEGLRHLSAAQLRSGGAAIILERMEMLRTSVTTGLLLLTLGALAIEGRRRRWLPAPAAVIVLCGLLAADLWIIDRKFYAPLPASRGEAVLQPDELMRLLQQQPRPFRLAPLRRSGEASAREFASNRYAAFGLENIGGYQPAKLRIYDDLIRSGAIDKLPVLSMLNAGVLLSDQELDERSFPLIARARVLGGQQVYVHRNPGGARRAWFVGEARALSDGRAVLDGLQQPDFDPGQAALLEARDAEGLPESFSAGEVQNLALDPRRIEARVSVTGPQPGLLVFSEIFYAPGWRLAVDGQEAPLHRVDHVLRAALVPPGEHVVRLEAVSRARAAGRLVSRLASLAALGLLGFAWVRRGHAPWARLGHRPIGLLRRR
jgi:hypothetical protein